LFVSWLVLAVFAATNRQSVSSGPQGGFLDGLDPKPAPFGVSFTGRARREPRLITLAYAFE